MPANEKEDAEETEAEEAAANPEKFTVMEKALAQRHLHDGALVLYDVSSSYLEGRHCELARPGY